MMKTKILFTAAFLCFAVFAIQAQDYYGDILPIYSLSDMNVKGDVKSIKEQVLYYNAEGNLSKNKEENFFYEFDKTGKLTKVAKSDMENVITSKYHYSNGQISKITQHINYTERPATEVIHSPNKITYKTDGRSVVFYINDGKITERKYYYTSEEDNLGRHIYEYNSQGKISKDFTGDSEDYTEIFYYYDNKGNISKKEYHEEEEEYGSTHYITDYTYTFDKNKNWTKVIEKSHFAGEEKYTYTQRIRTYEFY